MEKKQGFFSALKDEVVQGLSPARSASLISGLLRRRKHHEAAPEPLIARSGSLRPMGETLTPLMEGPDAEGCDGGGEGGKKEGWGHWMKGQLSRAPSSSSSAASSAYRRSDLRLLLGIMGAPLTPVHVSTIEPLPHLSIKDAPIIGDKHIRVDRACPPRKKLKGDDAPLYDNKRTVFVGNLPFDVKDAMQRPDAKTLLLHPWIQNSRRALQSSLRQTSGTMRSMHQDVAMDGESLNGDDQSSGESPSGGKTKGDLYHC